MNPKFLIAFCIFSFLLSTFFIVTDIALTISTGSFVNLIPIPVWIFLMVSSVKFGLETKF
jgi:hypothetical protein